MAKRFLLAGCDIPGWGGAATCQYQLFANMHRDGVACTTLNLVHPAEAQFLREQWGETFANPRSLDDVHTQILTRPIGHPEPKLTKIIETFAPDLIVAFGGIATVILKAAAPEIPLTLMTIGSHQIQLAIESGKARDYVHFQHEIEKGTKFAPSAGSPEPRAMQLADSILIHSPVVEVALRTFFPDAVGKVVGDTISFADFVYAEADAVTQPQLPFAERDIDVIFIASNWRRMIKNYPMVRELATRCSDLNIHVVGADADPPPGCHRDGVVSDRTALYGLLRRSKTVACPSLVDAAPGVLFEGSAMGCNVVASANCGNWRLCNDELLAAECSSAAFEARIRASVRESLPDNREFFAGGYRRFLEAIASL